MVAAPGARSRVAIMIAVTAAALALAALGAARIGRAVFGETARARGPAESILAVVVPGCSGCESTLENLARLGARRREYADLILVVSRGDSAATADLARRLPFAVVEEGAAGLGPATSGLAIPILRAYGPRGRLLAQRFGARSAPQDSAFVARAVALLQAR